ncbi:hypothetical protein O5O45_26495 [Hahella aquimaris]|uniref:hypothetical protein n=1 Tax=Hahella sp. HNIBRBA332 TaxID=3015983 RepID=UPI00273B106D|nr:hypothetical protein [Hahella sp. HNIBRBA332]WLQ13281.1 hypothetical protein O5O45_26495 [Hahella sp. HNIBRBA332]
MLANAAGVPVFAGGGMAVQSNGDVRVVDEKKAAEFFNGEGANIKPEDLTGAQQRALNYPKGQDGTVFFPEKES